jgi:hypothetical protein
VPGRVIDVCMRFPLVARLSRNVTFDHSQVSIVTA